MNDLNDVLVNIHLYLQNSKTEQEAYENIKFIKQCGFKILVTSPKILPERFYDVIDIFYHDKENQLFIEEYEDIGVMYHFLTTGDFTLKFGVEAMAPLCQSSAGMADCGMNLERWQTLVQQIEALEDIPKDSVKAEECFNATFLPGAKP